MRSTSARSSIASKTRSRESSAAARFFVSGARAAGETVELAADDAHKIRSVLRLSSGDGIEVIDSAGVTYTGTLSVERTAAAVLLDRVLERATEPSLRVTLAQGVPKGAKMDYVIEKATEIGISAVRPFFAARTIGEHVGDAKLERWRRIARSAATQSGRTAVPPVEQPATWSELLDAFGSYDRVLVAWEVAQREPLLGRLRDAIAGARSVLLVIGPEGGLSHGEVEAARDRGAIVVSLGPRILRTETAGIVAATALLLAAGDL